MLPGCLDIAAEELLAQPERDREVENDPQVRTGLTPRGDQRSPQLDGRLRILTSLEPNPQRLRLPRARRGQNDVRLLRGRTHEQVRVDEEVQRAERVPA